jgi:hypothetical protein
VKAAKPPPVSSAFYAYRAATSDAERRAVYPALTQSDRDAIIADARKSSDARMKVLVDERRADAAAVTDRSDARALAAKIVDEARIAALPPAIRRGVEWKRLVAKTACAMGTCLFIAFIVAQLMGEVGYFVWSLFHDWIVWALLIGANVVIFSLIMIAAYWRVIVSVMRALPSAISVAMRMAPE